MTAALAQDTKVDSLDDVTADLAKLQEAAEGPLDPETAYKHFQAVNALHDRVIKLERGPFSGRASELFSAFVATRGSLVRWMGDYVLMGL